MVCRASGLFYCFKSRGHPFDLNRRSAILCACGTLHLWLPEQRNPAEAATRRVQILILGILVLVIVVQVLCKHMTTEYLLGPSGDFARTCAAQRLLYFFAKENLRLHAASDNVPFHWYLLVQQESGRIQIRSRTQEVEEAWLRRSFLKRGFVASCGTGKPCLERTQRLSPSTL